MKKIQLKVNHLTVSPLAPEKTYITTYLKNLGISEYDIPSFIDTPRPEDEDNPWLLDNIKDAVKVGYEYFSVENNLVFVQVDSDTDGYTSSSILVNYLNRRFPNLRVQHRLHDGKEHGIIPSTVPAAAKLVVIPDAGSNQFDEQKELVDAGKTVIILDHHEVDGFIERPNLYLVNNQASPRFSNKYMSGAGIVYMYIRAMDETYFPNNPIYMEYRDLAATGIIADAMNMTSLGNNFLAIEGLRNLHSKFLKSLAQKQSRGIKDPEHLTKIDVAFYIAPVINGVVRSGSAEDKEMVFTAMSTNEDDHIYLHEWRGTVTEENLWDHAVRLAANAKGRQDSAKKKAFEWLCGYIDHKGWDKDNVIIVPLDEQVSSKVSPNITGLIAMELVKHYNKPSLLLRQTEFDGKKMFGGSGRNGNFFGLPDFRQKLAEAGGYYQEGHANAFGSFLLPEQVQTVRDYFNTHLDSKTFNDTLYEVDYWFHTGEPINNEMLFELASYDDIWGNSLPQPKIAADINYRREDILIMGKTHDSVKIKINGIDFVSFKNAALVKELEEHPEGHATIVGRPQLNVWMGRASVQMMIDDISIFDGAAQPSSLASLI